MKRWFLALPIHRKLTALVLGVSTAALLAAVIGLAVFDIARFRTAAQNDAHGLAQLLAENLGAALVFDDTDAAHSTLSSLRVRPTTRVACVYRANGTLLASYVRDGDGGCPAQPVESVTWRSVVTAAAVQQSGRTVGTVLVERDLSDLGERVMATGGAGVLMLLVGFAIALGLARTFQRVVSRPIVGLAQAARAVGREHRYELPPIDAPPDETGELVHAFGEMVRSIGEANAALLKSNEVLREEVDQRRRMQTEREALLAREREASRLKDEFLAAVSHELRTPLNAILGWTQILQSTRPSEQTVSRAIASLARNAQAQNRVIEDLLDISRIITGKLQLSVTTVDLREVIEAAIEVVDPIARSKPVTLEAHLPEQPCLVRGDYDRLRQVSWNLLSNALKFTPAGGRVDVRLEEQGAGFTVSVSDNGIGIAPSFLSHVFERFRQADGSTTREQGGLGLGLAIVKELTELHGGTVRAESAGQGQGATFMVTIPRAVMARVGDLDHAAPDEAMPRLDGISVLVVDDNADALDVVGFALERAGAQVREVLTGAAAIDSWQQQPADVLLCDLAMPGMDGFEVLDRIRAIDAAAGRPTRAVAVTAYASEDYRVRCLRAGFVGHLAKPYNIADVVRAVVSAMRTAEDLQ